MYFPEHTVRRAFWDADVDLNVEPLCLHLLFLLACSFCIFLPSSSFFHGSFLYTCTGVSVYRDEALIPIDGKGKTQERGFELCPLYLNIFWKSNACISSKTFLSSSSGYKNRVIKMIRKAIKDTMIFILVHSKMSYIQALAYAKI